MAKNKYSQQLKISVPLLNFLPFLSNGSVSSFSFSSCIVDTEEIFETFYLKLCGFLTMSSIDFYGAKVQFSNIIHDFIHFTLTIFFLQYEKIKYGKTSIEIG